jgi:hypothetical protein
MGKFIRSWLPLLCLFLVIDVFVARPDIPAAIHKIIERLRTPREYGPPPAPIPEKWRHTPLIPNPPVEPKPQTPAQPTKLIMC